MLTDWLTDMHLARQARWRCSAGTLHYKPYATSHAELDRDSALFVETRNAALTLAEAVTRYRNGEMAPGSGLIDPRPK